MHTDQAQISFDWTATHHFAAVDHLRHSFKRGLTRHVLLLILLCALVFLGFAGADFSYERVAEFLWFLVPIAVLSAAFWAVFVSESGRRLLFHGRPGIPCALRFDEHGISVAIGKSRLNYPWSKVCSIDENAEYVFVVASRSTCYAIPKLAFGNPLEGEHFATRMRRFLAP